MDSESGKATPRALPWGRVTAGVALASLTAGLPFGTPVASAYQWVDGPGRSCPSGWNVSIGATVYGDWNLYSNYGRENWQYNIPYNEASYAVAWTTRQSISKSAAEAENKVSSGPGTDCIPF